MSLHMLEAVLRNRIHAVMTEAQKQEDWFQNQEFILGARQGEQLVKAMQDIWDEGKEPTPGRIVASLTFGFLDGDVRPALRNLWQTTLHGIARRPGGTGLERRDFSRPLRPIRELRNRIAHHEPIISWTCRSITPTSWS